MRTYVLYTSKKKGEKRAAFESNVQTLSQNLNNSKTFLVTVYILICMERGRKSNPQICYSFFAYINSKNVI